MFAALHVRLCQTICTTRTFALLHLQSTAALPFGTIVIMILIWTLVTIPLTVFGGIAGKNNRSAWAPYSKGLCLGDDGTGQGAAGMS